MANQFFTGKVLTTVSIVVFVVLLILLVVFAINALLLIFGAILFAVFLRGLADLLAEKTGLGKGLSLAAVGLLLRKRRIKANRKIVKLECRLICTD